MKMNIKLLTILAGALMMTVGCSTSQVTTENDSSADRTLAQTPDGDGCGQLVAQTTEVDAHSAVTRIINKFQTNHRTRYTPRFQERCRASLTKKIAGRV
jgi:hypothetical protein